MKELMLKTPKPRNPLVASSLMRKAGSHRRGGGALRQRAKQALRLFEPSLPRRP
jgi:hypothetical protein